MDERGGGAVSNGGRRSSESLWAALSLLEWGICASGQREGLLPLWGCRAPLVGLEPFLL